MRAIYQSQAQVVMVQLERVTKQIDERRKAGLESVLRLIDRG